MSPHADAFIVKGATLFTLWSGEPHRATRDLDLLGYGSTDLERIAAVFRSLCEVSADEDALLFDSDSVTTSRIKEGDDYEGVRAELLARLGTARISLQVDVGFGDAVTPTAVLTTFPTMLEMAPPRLRAYQRETVVAEKLHAMVMRGLTNSRMKDFFDVWLLARNFDFVLAELAAAVRDTFARRGAPMPSQTPVALTGRFADDGDKLVQWRAFLGRARPVVAPPPLSDVISQLAEFLIPVLDELRAPTGQRAQWPHGGPWA